MVFNINIISYDNKLYNFILFSKNIFLELKKIYFFNDLYKKIRTTMEGNLPR